jgi:hypothetical protein
MTTYKPTDEDVQMMLKQITIEEEEAKKWLLKCNGNIFNAICCAMGEEDMMEQEEVEENIDISENHINPKERISQFRNILDKKDEMFMDVTKKDEDISDDLHDIGFVAFSPDTKNFSKNNLKLTLKSFIEIIAKPFIETGKLEDHKLHTFQEIKQDPNILGKKPVSEEEMKEIQEANKKLYDEEEDKKQLQKQLTELETKYEPKTETEILLTSEYPNIHIDVNVDTELVENDNKVVQSNEDNLAENKKAVNENDEDNIESIIQKIDKPIANKEQNDATESIKKQLALYFDDKLEIKPLTGKSNNMVKKWRCMEAGIIYKDSNIKSSDMIGLLETQLESKEMNIIATKLMINANIIKKTQFYTGNVLVVDKWFHYNKQY